jgi:hypothetical protein
MKNQKIGSYSKPGVGNGMGPGGSQNDSRSAGQSGQRDSRTCPFGRAVGSGNLSRRNGDIPFATARRASLRLRLVNPKKAPLSIFTLLAGVCYTEVFRNDADATAP